MNLTHKENVLIANNLDDFCEQILKLKKSKRLWSKISDGGLKIHKENYSNSALREKLKDIQRNL